MNQNLLPWLSCKGLWEVNTFAGYPAQVEILYLQRREAWILEASVPCFMHLLGAGQAVFKDERCDSVTCGSPHSPLPPGHDRATSHSLGRCQAEVLSAPVSLGRVIAFSRLLPLGPGVLNLRIEGS